MTNRTLERIRLLTDPGSFEPFKPLSGAGFHLGSGTMDGRPLYVLAADVDASMTVNALDAFARVSEFLSHILTNPAPLVQVLDVQTDLRADSGKTFIPPGGLELLAHDQGMGRVFSGLGRLEGVVPRLAIVLGPAAASRSFPAALADATVMLESASLCLGRPDAVRRMVGQSVDFHTLGGPAVQADGTGTVHKVVATERGAFAWARHWLSLMPTKAGDQPLEKAPRPPREDVEGIGARFEADLNAPVDIHGLLDAVFDGGSWIEMGETHAAETVTGLARIDGRSVGIVANNSNVMGGILHPASCRKMARFIRMCGWFGLPLVFLADTPGYMVGEDVERDGNVQAAADLYAAIARCPSPRVCVVVRKAYSAGLYAMAGPGFDSTFWVTPKASVSIFGPEALRRFRDGQQGSAFGVEAMDEMLRAALDPAILQEKELVDDIVQWNELRKRLATFAGQALNPA